MPVHHDRLVTSQTSNWRRRKKFLPQQGEVVYKLFHCLSIMKVKSSQTHLKFVKTIKYNTLPEKGMTVHVFKKPPKQEELQQHRYNRFSYLYWVDLQDSAPEQNEKACPKCNTSEWTLCKRFKFNITSRSFQTTSVTSVEAHMHTRARPHTRPPARPHARSPARIHTHGL